MAYGILLPLPGIHPSKFSGYWFHITDPFGACFQFILVESGNLNVFMILFNPFLIVIVWFNF